MMYVFTNMATVLSFWLCTIISQEFTFMLSELRTEIYYEVV
jgi:hypothetical protein